MPSDWIRRWIPVRVKKSHQIENPQPRFDSIETEKALGREPINVPIGLTARVRLVPDRRRIVASQRNDAMCQPRRFDDVGATSAFPPMAAKEPALRDVSNAD